MHFNSFATGPLNEDHCVAPPMQEKFMVDKNEIKNHLTPDSISSKIGYAAWAKMKKGEIASFQMDCHSILCLKL